MKENVRISREPPMPADKTVVTNGNLLSLFIVRFVKLWPLVLK
jgi:hypothetical protein